VISLNLPGTLPPASRIQIATGIVGLTLLCSVVIMAATPPASGYELSLYEAYPPILWVLIAVTVFFSMYTIIKSCESQLRNLYYGYFSILFINTLILFLPIIRGYYSMSRGEGDMYFHMFIARQIVHSGYLPVTDIYPVMHIWLSVLYCFLPDYIVLTVVLSAVFFILYVLSLYILGKTLLGTHKGGILVSIFGLPLLFSNLHDGFIPFFFALLIFPLILYAYQKITDYPAQKNRFYICLVVLSLFIVFCHPMISVFLLIMFSIFTVYELFKGRATGRQSNIEAANIVVIVFLTLALWWLQNSQALNTLQTIAAALFEQGSHLSIFAHQVSRVSTSNASIWLVIDRFFKIYGPVCLYFSIALLFLLYLTYQYFQNRKLHETDFIYSLQFCAAVCMGIVLVTGYFVIAEPIRAASFALVIATILSGLFFYRQRNVGGLMASITVILTVVCMMTILTLHASPWIGGTNSAFTYGDKNGVDWLLTYRNTEIPVVKEELSNLKYAQYFYEATDIRNSRNVSEYAFYRNLNKYTEVIPSHFGYTVNRTIGESFAYIPEKEAYMTTTELMRRTVEAVQEDRRSQVKSFTDAEFIRLKNDPTINLVYVSNTYGVWTIAIP
jgi:hypothetical protein